MSRRRERDCRRTKASFETLLCVEFDVIFEVDAEIDEGSITVEAVDLDEADGFDGFR